MPAKNVRVSGQILIPNKMDLSVHYYPVKCDAKSFLQRGPESEGGARREVDRLLVLLGPLVRTALKYLCKKTMRPILFLISKY